MGKYCTKFHKTVRIGKLQDSADASIEQPSIQLLEKLDWHTPLAYHESFGSYALFGRENDGEVVLFSRLPPALERFIPGLPAGDFWGDTPEISLSKHNSVETDLTCSNPLNPFPEIR